MPPEAERPASMVCTASENGALRIEVQVAPGTESIMVGAFTQDGRRLRATSLEGPGMVEGLDLGGEHLFLGYTNLLHGGMSVTLLPMVPELGHPEPGLYTIHFETRSESVCWYTVREVAPGHRLDVDVHLVGLPGLNSEAAASDPRLGRIWRQVRDIFESQGLTIGELRYHDVSAADAARFAVLRSHGDFAALMTRARWTRADDRGAHLFLVRSFMYDDGTGPVGLSGALPGPVGLGGHQAAGVAVSTESLELQADEEAERLLAIAIAHELGHWLGLLHTSEASGQRHDPIRDTPECHDFAGSHCPDLGNVMFPFADTANVSLTPGQAWTLRASPATVE